MSNFNSERVQKLKFEFYKVTGQLEVEKNIVISDNELLIFENHLSECKSEVEAAGFISGAIRKYKIQLIAAHDLVEKQHEEEIFRETVNAETSMECLIVEPDIFHLSPGTVNDEAESRPVESNQEGASSILYAEESIPNQEGASFNLDADESIRTDESPLPDESLIVAEKILTNTLIGNDPTVLAAQFTTTRDNPSFFLVYSKLGDYDIGCEFTLRRKGRFPRYECRKCRQLCCVNKKAGLNDQKSCAITMNGNQIKEIKKASHHKDCFVEYSGTAYARSVKNEAVVHKSKFGGSSKQVYDTHSKVLTVAGKEYNITASDMANGYKTFERAKSALKKASSRKSALTPSVVKIDELGIDRNTTKIVKSTTTEPDDYFLIGQDVAAGVVVLGSRFLVERFFRANQVMSDGTFKIAPIGFKQTYMLWYVAGGQYKDETVERSKAMLSVCFLLKDKKQQTYATAFKILDDYRKDQNIPDPFFEEFLTDDEPAVRNAISEIYTDTNFALCLFHHNQNIVKCLVQHKLTCFVRKCKDDEQLWFYGQLKKILAIPLLPENEMIAAFKLMSNHIMEFVDCKFVNPFEKEQFKKFFETVENRYFSSTEKMKMICKHGKSIRTTNPVEAKHGVFNKSSIIAKNGTVSNFIASMQVTDLQFRSLAIDFETNGAGAFPKKRNLYAKQQAVILECTESFNKKEIDIDKFLEKCAVSMIHEKYYVLIEAATKAFEAEKENPASLDNLLDGDDEFDENIQAIFATEQTSSKRVRKLCSKYFGEDWLN